MKDPYNPATLHAELVAAGLKIEGCSSQGRIDWIGEPTEDDLRTASTVLAAHDNTKLPAREALLAELRDKRTKGEALTVEEQAKVIDMFLGI